MLSLTIRKPLRSFTLNVSLELANHTLALVGFSGSGKTTLLTTLAGLREGSQGRIMLDGQVLMDSDQAINLPVEKRRIGFVFQNYALFPHLTVEDNVRYGLNHLPTSEQDRRLRSTLNRLGIEPLARALPHALSGGQQQRVALARALVTEPRLLLLDEPLSALDVSTRGHIRYELRKILDSLGIPSIVVTHDFEDARVLGNEIAVMAEGHIIQRGTPEKLAEKPASPFVALFTGTNVVTNRSETTIDGTIIQHQTAFFPWDAKISSNPPPPDVLSWYGPIADTAVFGNTMRLTIRHNPPLLVDRTGHDTKDFVMGQNVYVIPDEQKLRHYSVTLPPTTAGSLPPASDQELLEVSSSSRAMRRIGTLGFFRTPFVTMISAIFLAAITTGFISFHSQTSSRTLIALVAANATTPFNTIIQSFQRSHHGVAIRPSYAGTQILQSQVQQGSPDSLFLSADRTHMRQMQKEGLIRKYFAVSHDQEVLVVPSNNPAHIQSIKDLAQKPVSLIIGVSSVPIGQYTRAIFQKANHVYGPGFSQAAMSHVKSMETNVKQILEKVAMGNGQAGIVYQTDVTPNFRKQVKVIPIPSNLNIIAANYIAVPVHAVHPHLSQALLRFMLSAKGQAIFKHDGYLPVH